MNQIIVPLMVAFKRLIIQYRDADGGIPYNFFQNDWAFNWLVTLLSWTPFFTIMIFGLLGLYRLLKIVTGR